MTEEIQDGQIKYEKEEDKDGLDKNEARYEEYISSLVKIETNQSINEFEEMQDWPIKTERLYMKEEWEETEAKYKEYISTPQEASVEVVTHLEKNDFKKMPEIVWKEHTIKNEELDFKEYLEGSATSVSSECVYRDNQAKCVRYAPEKNDQLDHEISLTSNLYLNLLKSDHRTDKIVEENSLKKLELQHNRILEETKAGLLNCDQCDYQTVWEDNLNTHKLSHKNEKKKQLYQHIRQKEVEMFKCIQCNFQTKHKKNVKRHLRVHNTVKEVPKFKCDQCDYGTVFKPSLTRHLLRHMNPEEVEMFKCNNCDFKTKYKHHLNIHLLRHNNPEEVKKFECDQCPYKTIIKTNLTRHRLKHRKPEEVKRFMCNICCLQTKYKHNLNIHMLRHHPLFSTTATNKHVLT